MLYVNYVRAKHFLSIGEPLEINFRELGPIVHLRGENRDHAPGASNGSGKSTVFNAVVYAFYGELVKNLNHTEAINLQAKRAKRGGQLEVEVGFSEGGHEYVINRRRRKDELSFFRDGEDISGSGIPATQEKINAVVRLTCDAFVNVVCFGQHNNKQFLACNAAQKRAVAESLLSLDKYNRFCKKAKDDRSRINDQLVTATAVYQKSLEALESANRHADQVSRRQDEWRSSELNAAERLKAQVAATRAEMARVSAPAAKSSEDLEAVSALLQKKTAAIAGFREAIPEVEAKLSRCRDSRQETNLSLKEAQFHAARLRKDIDAAERQAAGLLGSEGTRCPTCHGQVTAENFQPVLTFARKQTAEWRRELGEAEARAEQLRVQLAKQDESVDKLRTACARAQALAEQNQREARELERRKALAESAIRDNPDAQVMLLSERISLLQEQIVAKQEAAASAGPFADILASARADAARLTREVAGYRDEVRKLSDQLPYYDFWVRGFGDDGIRSLVIRDVTPLLNDRINYWMQFLVDNKIRVTFDDALKETIDRNPSDGDPFVYSSISGGEGQCVDLGISQGFANVTMLTSGTCPSVVFLDEVGTNLDRPGIFAVYAMICELSRDRQVIVTTHHPDLQELLSAHDVITVVKEGGFTRIKNEHTSN